MCKRLSLSLRSMFASLDEAIPPEPVFAPGLFCMSILLINIIIINKNSQASIHPHHILLCYNHLHNRWGRSSQLVSTQTSTTKERARGRKTLAGPIHSKVLIQWMVTMRITFTLTIIRVRKKQKSNKMMITLPLRTRLFLYYSKRRKERVRVWFLMVNLSSLPVCMGFNLSINKSVLHSRRYFGWKWMILKHHHSLINL